MNIVIKKTKRKKTISIQIKNGLIDVRAPQHITQVEIDSFIQKKMSWIKKKVDIQNKIIAPKRKKFLNSENFLFMGKECKLNITILKNKKNYIDDSAIQIVMKEKDINNKSKVKAVLEKTYRKYALQILTEKTMFIASSINVEPEKIKVRSYKGRWGTCSYRKDISFNWKLIMAPEKIIEYVIVHELCHLIHFNHSKNFWESVENILPDYKLRKDWLRTNEGLLEW
jgi:predicted metal-dependent hydrolase|tara:strand:+ start:139 stop:816 length:678 start_codon:yes stop_codon:yes gene_type:complete